MGDSGRPVHTAHWIRATGWDRQKRSDTYGHKKFLSGTSFPRAMKERFKRNTEVFIATSTGGISEVEKGCSTPVNILKLRAQRREKSPQCRNLILDLSSIDSRRSSLSLSLFVFVFWKWCFWTVTEDQSFGPKRSCCELNKSGTRGCQRPDPERFGQHDGQGHKLVKRCKRTVSSCLEAMYIYVFQKNNNHGGKQFLIFLEVELTYISSIPSIDLVLGGQE